MTNSLAIAGVRTRQICLGLFLVSFVSYLLFSHLVPITDPVESNYALTAKEMVKSGDWLSPRIYGQVWYDKPIFFYWLTALSYKYFGFSDLAARLNPALFAGLGVVLLYWFLNKTTSQSVALVSTIVMGTSLEYVLLAKFVITDMVLFVFNSAALVFFFLGYTQEGGTKRWYWAMYASMALAVLTKGPVGLLLPGLVMFIFIAVQRNWAELSRMSIPAGLIIFSAITLPWYVAMYYVHGFDFINTFFGVHNYLRATVSEHPKDNVIYYYVVVFLLSMLPWAPLALKAMVVTWKDQSLRKTPLSLFCFIWFGVYFIFYSLMATKYLTYTFPTLFPVAIVTGNYLEQLLNHNKRNTILYWVGTPILFSTLGYIAATHSYFESLWLIAGSLILILVTIFVWTKIKESSRLVLGLLCVYQIAIYMALSIFIYPAIAETRSEKELAQNLLDYSNQQIGFYEFYSTSAVYYSGKTAVKLTSEVIDESPPTKLSWSSKYTMPTESLASFVTNSNKDSIVIVVSTENRKRFLEDTKNRNPQLVKTTDRFSYYYFEK